MSDAKLVNATIVVGLATVAGMVGMTMGAKKLATQFKDRTSVNSRPSAVPVIAPALPVRVTAAPSLELDKLDKLVADYEETLTQATVQDLHRAEELLPRAAQLRKEILAHPAYAVAYREAEPVDTLFNNRQIARDLTDNKGFRHFVRLGTTGALSTKSTPAL